MNQQNSKKTDDKQGLPLEKILTCSARDYCESIGKDLSDYNLKGIHSEVMDFGDYWPTIKDFAERIPNVIIDAIVDFRIAYNRENKRIYYGTALILKDKK